MLTPLSLGENHLILGGEGSIYQFTVLLEPAATS
jgi:hypothetical protein